MRLLRKSEIPGNPSRGPSLLTRVVAACLLCLPALFAGGCSDDAPPGQDADAVQGKTPVVRPEDVFVCGPGGASVLAPDYRREMASDLEAEGDVVSYRSVMKSLLDVLGCDHQDLFPADPAWAPLFVG